MLHTHVFSDVFCIKLAAFIMFLSHVLQFIRQFKVVSMQLDVDILMLADGRFRNHVDLKTLLFGRFHVQITYPMMKSQGGSTMVKLTHFYFIYIRLYAKSYTTRKLQIGTHCKTLYVSLPYFVVSIYNGPSYMKLEGSFSELLIYPVVRGRCKAIAKLFNIRSPISSPGLSTVRHSHKQTLARDVSPCRLYKKLFICNLRYG